MDDGGGGDSPEPLLCAEEAVAVAASPDSAVVEALSDSDVGSNRGMIDRSAGKGKRRILRDGKSSKQALSKQRLLASERSRGEEESASVSVHMRRLSGVRERERVLFM